MNDVPFQPEGYGGEYLSKYTQNVQKLILKQKDDLMRIALCEVEGKMPSVKELKKHGHIMVQPDTTELFMWKGKPLISFGKLKRNDDNELAIEYKFLYA